MENREVLLVLDDFAVCRKEDVLIYAGVKLPDVQLDEILCRTVMLHPTLYSCPCAVYTAPGNAAVGVIVHAAHDKRPDGLYDHPVNQMIG